MWLVVAVGNGRQAANHLLAMGDNKACPDVDGFSSDMVSLFNTCAPPFLHYYNVDCAGSGIE